MRVTVRSLHANIFAVHLASLSKYNKGLQQLRQSSLPRPSSNKGGSNCGLTHGSWRGRKDPSHGLDLCRKSGRPWHARDWLRRKQLFLSLRKRALYSRLLLRMYLQLGPQPADVAIAVWSRDPAIS